MEKIEELKKLEEMIQKFNIQNTKDKIIKSIEDTIQKLGDQNADVSEKEQILFRFIEKVLKDHERNASHE
jgi:lipoate-protein ligase A